jgi:hypothetical protein
VRQRSRPTLAALDARTDQVDPIINFDVSLGDPARGSGRSASPPATFDRSAKVSHRKGKRSAAIS